MIRRDCAARRTIAVKLSSSRSDRQANAGNQARIFLIPTILTVHDPHRLRFGVYRAVVWFSAAWHSEGKRDRFRRRVNINVLSREVDCALDHICSAACDVAAWNGDFLHVGRIHSHFANPRYCFSSHTDHSG